jgi:hypothetical protein
VDVGSARPAALSAERKPSAIEYLKAERAIVSIYASVHCLICLREVLWRAHGELALQAGVLVDARRLHLLLPTRRSIGSAFGHLRWSRGRERNLKINPFSNPKLSSVLGSFRRKSALLGSPPMESALSKMSRASPGMVWIPRREPASSTLKRRITTLQR